VINIHFPVLHLIRFVDMFEAELVVDFCFPPYEPSYLFAYNASLILTKVLVLCNTAAAANRTMTPLINLTHQCNM